jgi:hypothetical protein
MSQTSPTTIIFLYFFKIIQTMLGKLVSDEEITSFQKSGKNGVIDYDEKRIITAEEFYNPEGPHNLHWQELANVQKKSRCNGPIRPVYRGGFDVFLNVFLQELREKNLMSKGSPQIGDYFLIDVGGITVKLPDPEPGPWGAQKISTTYYPRVREDAEEYAKHFFSNASYPVYVAQILSVPNKE